MQFKSNRWALSLAVGACTALGSSAVMAASQPYAMVTFALQRSAPAAAVPVPAIGDWLLFGMALLVAVGGVLALRRKAPRGLAATLIAGALALGGWGADPMVRSAYANANASPLELVSGLFMVGDGTVSTADLTPQSLFSFTGGRPLDTIFIGAGSTSPSFIAQVFGSSFADTGAEGRSFLGFGSGNDGAFGGSTFSALFNQTDYTMVIDDVQGYAADGAPFGLQGVFGAPTLTSAPVSKGSAAAVTVLCQPGSRIPAGGSCAIGLVDRNVSGLTAALRMRY